MTLFLFNAGKIFFKIAVQGNTRCGTVDFFVMCPAAGLGFRFERGEGRRIVGEVISIEFGPVPGQVRSEKVQQA